MKKKKKLSAIFLALLLSSISLVSCEDDETICTADASYDVYLNSVSTFSSNPTTSNCNAMKAAAVGFIEDATSCGGYDISSVSNNINAIDCSGF